MHHNCCVYASSYQSKNINLNFANVEALVVIYLSDTSLPHLCVGEMSTVRDKVQIRFGKIDGSHAFSHGPFAI